MENAFPNCKLDLQWRELCETLEKLKPKTITNRVNALCALRENTQNSLNNNGALATPPSFIVVVVEAFSQTETHVKTLVRPRRLIWYFPLADLRMICHPPPHIWASDGRKKKRQESFCSDVAVKRWEDGGLAAGGDGVFGGGWWLFDGNGRLGVVVLLGFEVGRWVAMVKLVADDGSGGGDQWGVIFSGASVLSNCGAPLSTACPSSYGNVYWKEVFKYTIIT
ncbi:hypothetical protein RND71_023099 [Anisodus tanguticus]|uniref:Uncharacterized protein n=1 Tax=Anisodus tanguticus TaxID=243964 RepID=A0AAE1VDH8_9SOLA|nr:hypothetical protein RND71_023099 [Anisodus tanguticus]